MTRTRPNSSRCCASARQSKGARPSTSARATRACSRSTRPKNWPPNSTAPRAAPPKDEVERMKRPIRILLQTTIPAVEDDWHVGRFSLLGEHLRRLRDAEGHALCEVTARDRVANADGDEEVLSRLDSTDFDELWLFAVDTGGGLTAADCQGITR